MKAYGRSKLANVMFTYELAHRLEGTGVTTNALHPGAVATGIGTNNKVWYARPMLALFRLFSTTPEKGAETSVYLASSPEVESVTGQYFANKKPVASSKASHDEEAAKRLWRVSEAMDRSSRKRRRLREGYCSSAYRLSCSLRWRSMRRAASSTSSGWRLFRAPVSRTCSTECSGIIIHSAACGTGSGLSSTR